MENNKKIFRRLWCWNWEEIANQFFFFSNTHNTTNVLRSLLFSTTAATITDTSMIIISSSSSFRLSSSSTTLGYKIFWSAHQKEIYYWIYYHQYLKKNVNVKFMMSYVYVSPYEDAGFFWLSLTCDHTKLCILHICVVMIITIFIKKTSNLSNNLSNAVNHRNRCLQTLTLVRDKYVS